MKTKWHLLYWLLFSVTLNAQILQPTDTNIEYRKVENKIIFYEVTWRQSYDEDWNPVYVTTKKVFPLTIYYLNEYGGNIYFLDRARFDVLLYKPGAKEARYSGLPNQDYYLGADNEYVYTFTWNAPVIPAITRWQKEIFGDETSNGYYVELIDGTSGFPDELSSRMYHLIRLYGTKFAATVTLDEERDFLKPYYFMTGGDFGKDDKGSLLPRPIKNREVQPSKIMILDVKGPYPLIKDEKLNTISESDFDYYPLPLDFSAYGITGELTEEDLFKMEEVLGYSSGMKKIAFVGRRYTDTSRTRYRESIYLVPEEGGRPEEILRAGEGHVVQDMLFSPDGYQLVLEMDDGDLYEVTFPGYRWEETYPTETALTKGIREGTVSRKEIQDYGNDRTEAMAPAAIERYLDTLYDEVCMRDIKQIETNRNDLCRYYLNTLHAYRGYQFGNENWQRYYETFPWYDGKTKEPEFSEEEQRRIDMVLKIERGE